MNQTAISNEENASTSKSEVGGPYFNEEHGVAFDCWLNLYDGMDIDPMTLEPYKTMTIDQKEVYETFLQQVESIDWDTVEGIDPKQPLTIPDRWTCLRFLQADKYDASSALKRIISTQRFHHQYKVSQIISGKPANLDSYRKLRRRACMGLSKDGTPVFVERLGQFMCAIPSLEGQALTSNDYIECFLYDIGLLFSAIRKSYQETCNNDKVATNWKAMWIMDAADIRYYRALKSVPTLKLIDSITEPNFPELAGQIYLVNVPIMAYGLWKIFKAFLDPTVASKIQLFSGVPTELFLTKISKDVLLEEYGGANTSVEFPKAEYII